MKQNETNSIYYRAVFSNSFLKSTFLYFINIKTRTCAGACDAVRQLSILDKLFP